MVHSSRGWCRSPLCRARWLPGCSRPLLVMCGSAFQSKQVDRQDRKFTATAVACGTVLRFVQDDCFRHC